MANTTARVALLGGYSAGGWARGRLMARLTAVVAQALLGGAVLSNVSDYER